MYVEPSTDVYILKNCPLESNYEHTVIFESKDAQEAYFLSLAKYHPTSSDQHKRATYQRVNLNSIKIELPVEKLYDCNYMMFKNEYFENKWFYAFITSVEYVNNRTSLINYYIDVMQTWFFEAKLQQCFVEREHVTDDRIGANTVPESLDMGDSMIYHYMDKAEGFSWKPNESGLGEYYIEIVTVFDENGEQSSSDAGMYGGVYSALNYIYFSTIEGANAYINGIVKNHGEDGVIGVYMIPKHITCLKDQPPLSRVRTIDVKYASNWKYSWENKIQSPRNNKLYTAPFTNIICNNMVGGMAEYKVEDLCWEATEGRDEDGEPIWTDREKYLDTKKELFYYTLEGISGAPPKCLMMPTHYAGQENARNNQLTIDNFPQCAFVTDSYRAWVAMHYRQYSAAAISSGINGVVGSAASIAHKNPIGVLQNITGTATTIGDLIAEREKAKVLPNKEHGMTAPDLAMANDSLGFRFYCSHIRPEIAKRIDDYFDRYGYQVNTNKVPNREARPHWSYVKTSDCTITGDLPDDDKQKIIAVYNRGITFWKKAEELGDYSLDNRVPEDKRTSHLDPLDWWDVDPSFEESQLQQGEYPFMLDVVTQEEMEFNAQTVYKMLKDRGWTNGAIIGVIANMDYFSDIDPAYRQEGKIGLLKWASTRKINLLEFLNSNGFADDSGVGQVRYLDEMTEANDEWVPTTGFNISFGTFKNPPSWGTASDSAICFYHCYMRGSNSAVEEELKSLAQKWNSKLKESNAYQQDSTDNDDDYTYVPPTDPETGTGSSSITAKTPNPVFYTTRGTEPLTFELMRKNALAVYNILKTLGWSTNAICAVLGNWEVTSGLDPFSYTQGNDSSIYCNGDRFGFSHWRGERLKNLFAYLVKYNHIHWYSDDDVKSLIIADYLPDSLMDKVPAGVDVSYFVEKAGVSPLLLLNKNLEKGQVMFLHDKGGTSSEWKKSSSYNISFSDFRKNNSWTIDKMTKCFAANHMRGNYDSDDIAKRVSRAKSWSDYIGTQTRNGATGGGTGGGGR